MSKLPNDIRQMEGLALLATFGTTLCYIGIRLTCKLRMHLNDINDLLAVARDLFCKQRLRILASHFIAWASCQIRKIASAHAPGMPGTFSPSLQVSDPDMHHGTCVTHVPWCMAGSLTSGFLWNWRRGEMFPAFPAHAQPAIFRIW